jgi:DNA-binding transcriptional LysR family regulator
MQLSDRIGRRMKLQDLHVLMTVVQAGSMSKAASLLTTGQPAISRSIAELEHTVGVRLLERNRQGVEPTEYGRALLDGGLAVFDDLRQAVRKIEFIADPTVGEVRIGCNQAILCGLIPAVFGGLRRQHSGITVHVTPLTTVAQRYRELRERKVDLVLGRMPGSVDDDIAAEVLFYDRMLVVAGSRSRWARRRKIELAELADEPWSLPQFDSPFGSLVADAFRASGSKFPPKGVAFGPHQMFCTLVASEPFLSIFPDSLLRFGRNLPPLKVLPVNLPAPPWPIGIMTLKSRTPSPVTKLFVGRIREAVRPLAKRMR